MPTFFFPLIIITQIFEDETALAEALNFPEISRFDGNNERQMQAVRANVEEILKQADASELSSRLAPAEIEKRELMLTIDAPRDSKSWREPFDLKFHVLQWPRADNYHQAFVPALGIMVVNKTAVEFEAKLAEEIRAALARSGAAKSLHQLSLLERVRDLKIERTELAIDLKTAKQRVLEAENEPEEKSILEQVAINLNEAKLVAAYEVENYVQLLAEILASKDASSVLLIGKSGVGKTAIVHEVVRRRADFELGDKQFWATSGARLVAGQTGFGMWQERCQKLVDETRKQAIVLHLGNLIELLEVGKSVSNALGLASFFRPKIARGDLQVVVECTPEQLATIEKQDAALLGAFQQIRVEEVSRETNLKILQAVAQSYTQKTAQQNQLIAPAAIEAIDAVHRRYATYSAFPGRPIRLLRNLLNDFKKTIQYGNDDQSGFIVTPKIVLQAFSEETGLPLVLLSDAEKLDLDKLENWFEEKVLGQFEAVRLVVDLIATVKAKLVRPHKPIASLLFIGPTGVGKTELTKALAEFFFRDAARLVRFDMSEYASALAVARLIGGTGESEGLLTAKLREQPFSIVLFDEFEKADPQFFDLLLQILGEGRLTDAAGRTADFTNSIIVMTSNLGAEQFKRGRGGFVRNEPEKQTAINHFNGAVRDFLRPEIYNRLDRIVPFAPLDETVALEITRLEIEKLRKRDGLRFRPVKFEIAAEALRYLTEKGYDVRYGARPLRRAIERELLAPLAAALNEHSPDRKIDVLTTVKNKNLNFTFEIDKNAKKTENTDLTRVNLAARARLLRRKTQKLTASSHLTELEDEKFQIIRLKERSERGRYVSPENAASFERLPKIKRFLETARTFGDSAARLEDQILLEIYGKTEKLDSRFADELAINELRFEKVLLDLLSLKFEKPDEIRLEIYSENSAALFRLVRAYLMAIEDFGGEAAEISVFTTLAQPDEMAFVSEFDDETATTKSVLLFGREIWRQEITKPEEFFANTSKEVVGVLLRLESALARPRFACENGLHAFLIDNKSDNVWVNGGDFSLKDHLPPFELEPRDSVKAQTKRRIYDKNNSTIKDLILKKEFEFDGVSIAEITKQAIQENLELTAENLLE